MMSSTESNAYDVSSYNADELGEYRSLSTLAVVTLVLGLCSALVFVSPLMIVLPLATVATALLALRGIAASGGGLSGAGLARCGLALAIMFGVASFVRVKVRDTLLVRHADRMGQKWLSLATDNRAEDMLELMTNAAVDKIAPAGDGGPPMPFFGNVLTTALMRHDPLVVKLSERFSSDALRLELLDASVEAAIKPPQAVLRYVVRNADAEQQQCLLVLKRYAASERKTIWLIDSWALE